MESDAHVFWLWIMSFISVAELTIILGMASNHNKLSNKYHYLRGCRDATGIVMSENEQDDEDETA